MHIRHLSLASFALPCSLLACASTAADRPSPTPDSPEAIGSIVYVLDPTTKPGKPLPSRLRRALECDTPQAHAEACRAALVAAPAVLMKPRQPASLRIEADATDVALTLTGRVDDDGIAIEGHLDLGSGSERRPVDFDRHGRAGEITSVHADRGVLVYIVSTSGTQADVARQLQSWTLP